jgi:internalin A
VIDIRPLAGLDELETLNLNRNQITNAAPLRQLPNLERVYLYNNPVAHQVCPTNPNALCLLD